MSGGNYTMILADVVGIKEERGKMYETEPRTYAPIRALEGIALYKAIRAFESLSNEKKLDEYRDLINYCVFIIERLESEPFHIKDAKLVDRDEE
jgi:hypothetical protein